MGRRHACRARHTGEPSEGPTTPIICGLTQFALGSGIPSLDLPHGDPIYPITMPDRHPQFERDWLDSIWAVVIILAIFFFRYLTRR